MQKAFLAYPHKERALAEQVAAALAAEGISVWFDEQQINPGDEIASALREGINSASAVVLILGSQTYGDSWARKEAALALSKGKRVVPILPHKDAEVPYILRHLSYLDLSDETSRGEGLRRLARTLAAQSPDSLIRLDSSSARSEALAASSTELKAEIVEYEQSRMAENLAFSTATISAVISTVVSIAGLLFGVASEEMPKLFYVAAGVVGSLTALALALAATRLYLRKSGKNLEGDHE
jgi:TIR domain